MSKSIQWILASGSPRRRALLAQLCPHFIVISPEVPEWEPEEADPAEQVLENARRKARAVAARYPQALVLAADTTVALGRRLFAKPSGREEAISMLESLSGRKHAVLTGMVLIHEQHEHAFHESSEVEFKPLDRAAVEQYIDRVHVYDKAGAYAIQEEGDRIIAGYSGSFENIMGLPVQRLRQELVQLGWVAGLPADI